PLSCLVHGDLSELLAAADLRLEPNGVLVPVEALHVLPRAAAAVPPLDAVLLAPVVQRALLDHSCITPSPSARPHEGSLPDGPARQPSISSSSRRPWPARPDLSFGAVSRLPAPPEQ